MDIPEFIKRKEELEKLSAEEKEFLSNVCKGAGHEWFKAVTYFADICTRCGAEVSWIDQYKAQKIAKAMVEPLKKNLDYKTLGGYIIKAEQPINGPLPIYDEDLPDEKA